MTGINKDFWYRNESLGGIFFFYSFLFLNVKVMFLSRDWKPLEHKQHKNYTEDKNKIENLVMEQIGRLHQVFVFSEPILILDLLIIICSGKR